MTVLSRLTAVGDTVSTLAKAGFLTPMRPDRTVRMIAAARDEGLSITTGFVTAAQRCPDNPGLIDELGTLTWRELDERCHALAAALQQLPGGPGSDVAGPAAPPETIGVMCRNHRGFVEALADVVTRIGANVLLLNTPSPGLRWPTWSTASTPTPSSTTRSSPTPSTTR
jgi:acyl-CoA synthetase (AMP-forming)/AMP-acid ligase II